MSKMKPEVAQRRIESFGKRFGEAHLYLAYHAAFPLSLTPDLLYRLWVNFQRDIYGEVLGIPWIAVADLLLSSLCNEVGHELYEMNLAVRDVLLSRLKEHKKFGQQRIHELSNFLLNYIQQQLQSDDPDIRDFAQVQELTALAYTRPSETARELALAFSKLNQKDTAELLRITSLVETLAEPLAEFQPLLIYSHAMANFARGNLEGATDQFLELLEQERQVKLFGVTLPLPNHVRANLPTVSYSLSQSSPPTQFQLTAPAIRLAIPELIKVNLPTLSTSSRKFSLSMIGGAITFAMAVTIPAYSLLPSSQLSSPTLTQASPILKVGSSGQQVSEIQRCLSKLGYYNSPVTGKFASLTQNAVIRFQRANGLPAVGVVGARTQQTLDSRCQSRKLSAPISRGSQLGSRSESVTRLQQDLRRLGYFNGPITGYFGSETQRAVIKFQQSYGIRANGVADSQTLGAIATALGGQNPEQNYGCSTTGDICQGEKSQRVTVVQQRLQNLGFFNGNLSGYYGPATRDAVVQFQRNSGLETTGFVNYQTWQALGISNNSDNSTGWSPKQENRFVVVVPISRNDTLNQVRQYIPEAFRAESRLGPFINAGQFRERSQAEDLSKWLRSRGLDARVDYF